MIDAKTKTPDDGPAARLLALDDEYLAAVARVRELFGRMRVARTERGRVAGLLQEWADRGATAPGEQEAIAALEKRRNKIEAEYKRLTPLCQTAETEAQQLGQLVENCRSLAISLGIIDRPGTLDRAGPPPTLIHEKIDPSRPMLSRLLAAERGK